MNIKPIKTKADYRAALAEIVRLFGAAPGTPEGDRLDVLTTLVEAYEAQHEPIPVPDARPPPPRRAARSPRSRAALGAGHPPP